MFLVDTNVVSAGAPGRALSGSALLQWMEDHSDQLYLSVITVAELEGGIAKLVREGAKRKAQLLTEWFDTLLWLYQSRIIVLDVAAARLAGQLSDKARGRGHTPDLADVMIAATAHSRAYTVLTRNMCHFSTLGVSAHDPFAALPAT